MGRTFAIGDIHGCYHTFKKLLFEVLAVSTEDTIYLLGDFIDRGPRSKKVLKLILKMQQMGFHIKPLMGNHEIMLLGSIFSPLKFQGWMRSGGHSTLESFKVEHPANIKDKYLDFITGLPFLYETEQFIYVHGGLNFEAENPLEEFEVMPWIRNGIIDKTKIGNRRIIVGHTPSTLERINKSLQEDRILLDGGCVLVNANRELGYLVALEIEKWQLHTQQCIDFNE